MEAAENLPLLRNHSILFSFLLDGVPPLLLVLVGPETLREADFIHVVGKYLKILTSIIYQTMGRCKSMLLVTMDEPIQEGPLIGRVQTLGSSFHSIPFPVNVISLDKIFGQKCFEK